MNTHLVSVEPHECSAACPCPVGERDRLRLTIEQLRVELAAMKLQWGQAVEALDEAETALTQAFVDEANCDGLHVAKGHHGPRAKNDCFELWTTVPAHFEALKKVRAILESEE